MNNVYLDKVLQQYTNRFDEVNSYPNDEWYKWQAMNCFKEHWDLDSVNFPEMFSKSTSKTRNLIDDSKVQPRGGILFLLKYQDEIEFVRECFRALFSEDDGDIDKRQDRIDDFVDKINKHINSHDVGGRNYQQNTRSAIFYLNLWKPEDNYIYKYKEAAEWANCIEYGDDFGSGSTFSLKRYYKMCDELLLAIKSDDELLMMNKKRITPYMTKFNDKLHILVYDIIYCALTYGFYNETKSIKISTKERIHKAQLKEKIAELSKLIDETQHQLQLLGDVQPSSDLVGQGLTHTGYPPYGRGVITSIDSKFISVGFESCEKKFEYPKVFGLNIVSLDNSNYIISVHEDLRKIKQIENLNDQIKELKKEIGQLK